MAIVRALIVAIAAAWIFEALRVPAGALIGAMVGVAALNLADFSVPELPDVVRFLSFAALGWLLGSQFTKETLTQLREAALPIAVIVGLLLAAAVGATFWLRAAGFDTSTAFLAASPGGISQMAAISAEVGANAPLVVTVHLVRIMAVVFIAPFVARLVTRS
jgi:membrane AbrB-like protein